MSKKTAAMLVILTAVNTTILVTAAWKGYKASVAYDEAKKNPLTFIKALFSKPKDPAPGV